MLATITTGGSEIPLWLWLVATLGVGASAAAIGSFPWWKAHSDRAKTAVDRDRRIDETCKAVLGEESDPTVGRYRRTPGLIELVPELQETIGPRNGKSVMEHIVAIERHIGVKQ